MNSSDRVFAGSCLVIKGVLENLPIDAIKRVSQGVRNIQLTNRQRLPRIPGSSASIEQALKAKSD
jgi:hypothetical protein